jgi:glutathione S-transferase
MLYTLHAAPGACSFAPHIILEELGQPYELAMMSSGHPEAKTAEFRKINPKGRIPVLTAEGFVLTEAAAILLHLGLTNPQAGLIGNDAESITRSVEWMNWLSGAVHAVAVRMIWKPDFFLPDEALFPPLVAKGKEHLAANFAMVEERLTGRTWAVGTSYSVVDAYLLVFYRWGNRMAIDMTALYPTWTDHAKRMEARPAVQRAIAQEGISLWQ